MPGRITTTHVGSLPRPDNLVELNLARSSGQEVDDAAYDERLAAAISDVVLAQRDAGIDIVNDGEFGHSMGHRYDYGAWWSYVFQRLGGIELDPKNLNPPKAEAEPGKIGLAEWDRRRDWEMFREAYTDPDSGTAGPSPDLEAGIPVCTEPLRYVGQEAIADDIAHFKSALAKAGLQDGYLNSVAPGSCARFGNAFYSSDEEFLFACADAMREEYKAIIDSGLMLQLDDPAIAEAWDQINPEPSVRDYQEYCMVRVEALNHAIRGLPEDRIRFHLCWGSWHGPHVSDIEMKDIVDVMLAVNAGTYSFEAANVRHEHEWKIWESIKLPDHKKLMPGVVSHATNVVEHPELVADRIGNFTRYVGADRVVASTDCGLGGRIHPQIAWAKLRALGEGAELAGKRA